MSAPPVAGVRERAQAVAAEAGRHAAEVDAHARFPAEALAALRSAGLLSVLVPPSFGGEGRPLGEVAAATTVLARSCASTAMVYAMHQMQVACVVRHGRTPALDDLQRLLVQDQLLLASATTELGVGGDIRTSRCAVEVDAGTFRLAKQAPVISYGEQADVVLATARRSPDSPPNDQVLVACTRPGLTLDRVGEWDTLGLRGTCSLGFALEAHGPAGHVLADPFGDVATRTMLPVSHVLWGAVWLGLATEAVDRARRYVRAEARKQPGETSPAAVRLAELMALFAQLESLVLSAADRFDRLAGDDDALDGLGQAIAWNSLKVSASTLVVDIVGRAMVVCGMAAYRNDSPYSMGRLLRDAHGAAVMVNNDRILANTARMLQIHRES